MPRNYTPPHPQHTKKFPLSHLWERGSVCRVYLYGGWYWIRTNDPLLVRQMLSPTELITHSVCIRMYLWEGIRDLYHTLIKEKGKCLYRLMSGAASNLLCILLFCILLSFEYVHHLKNNILASTDSPTASNGSTIGTTWLNFCVRNGNRCTPRVINTKMLSSRDTKYRTIS